MHPHCLSCPSAASTLSSSCSPSSNTPGCDASAHLGFQPCLEQESFQLDKGREAWLSFLLLSPPLPQILTEHLVSWDIMNRSHREIRRLTGQMVERLS